jgi:FtsP/CotA-like multicopper oxidase with cupredoxin domain
MRHPSRRQFLAAAAGVIGALPALPMAAGSALAAAPLTIRIGTRVIEVNGRPFTVFGLTRPGGGHGLVAEAGRHFRVRLENQLDEEALIHWHGLTPPWQQDGVPWLSQAPIAASGSYDYDFPLTRPGTNWMHSHHGLQEQRLMAAPLIVRDPAEAGVDMQEVVVLFHDFTSRDPGEIYAGLRGATGGHEASRTGSDLHRSMPADRPAPHGMSMGQGGMDHGATGRGSGAAGDGGAGMHLHDVDYDAFLANDRTLDDPEIFRVERGGRVRLRLINGASATNFWIDLDRLEGRLVAVDGRPVAPMAGRRFEFAIAQRLDIILDLPPGDGAWPIFAVREGARSRTGFVLATRDGSVDKAAGEAEASAAPVGLALERRLRALQAPPDRQADRKHTITITEAPGYAWMLNGAVYGEHLPLEVRGGERVEITFVDRTTMAHPMHLHGHHFQVVAIDGQRFAGALRDTVLVPARGSVTVAFDAANPGKWALHCHHLYHMAAGMMTTVEYGG